jgi:hypothetical protein
MFIKLLHFFIKRRKYPQLPPPTDQPQRSISFVVVRFSDDYLHNILKSQCLKNPINELVTVDNTSNLYHDNLATAMAVGTSKARHELIAVVHEDVVLPDGWQSWFEVSLEALEMVDPNWGVLGAVGWTNDNKVFGHWSDPYRYANTFSGERFHRVDRLDEQILIFNRARIIDLDRDLPGFHHIGRDVPLLARRRGMKAYAIDAPTIHKYADQNGNIISSRRDSPKLVHREALTYKAERACCNEYIVHKWPQLQIQDYKPPELTLPDMDDALLHQLDKPVILLARGGGGSRLLSTLGQDIGVFLGNVLNGAGDCLEMVLPIYQGIIEKYHCRANWQKQQIVPRLRAAAANMLLKKRRTTGLWGFKLPESVLLLPEIRAAFPQAQFLHMVRDPVAVCLRRTHMTARLDNSIGRISLPLAYDFIGRPREMILEDSPAMHMAYTTIHQLKLVGGQLADISPDRQMQIRFEDIIETPTDCVERASSWLGLARKKYTLEGVVDPQRIQNPKVIYPPDVAEKVENVLCSLRTDYGYILR